MKDLNHISNETIRDDIQDTISEIEDYESELEILKKNPQKNKLDIYNRKGKVLERKSFVEELENILIDRVVKEADYKEGK